MRISCSGPDNSRHTCKIRSKGEVVVVQDVTVSGIATYSLFFKCLEKCLILSIRGGERGRKKCKSHVQLDQLCEQYAPAQGRIAA